MLETTLQIKLFIQQRIIFRMGIKHDCLFVFRVLIIWRFDYSTACQLGDKIKRSTMHPASQTKNTDDNEKLKYTKNITS